MAQPITSAIGLGALGVLLLAGCGSASSGGAATSSDPTSTATSSVAASPSASVRPPSPSLSTSPGDVTLQGTVSGDGLTCVGFVATDGKKYALTGPGLPAKLVAIAHSFGRRTALSSSPGPAQSATVTIVGHPVKGAMSTCSATVFLVTSAQIRSVTTR
ncbi:hypothetical protein [Allobranchiibius sp. CTAmp26]|uniref:hypothetical protein n=1 Tax=Allobranchiibius sp. CTAmp26 TaxID=2815214 RepID=UPI001AA17A66|nr:hypothetical protein [Allobranchiibius sp. CTAmp26]MBO1754799.1 hypothetical protein [Allobranchiibius sp. CTAmp26]